MIFKTEQQSPKTFLSYLNSQQKNNQFNGILWETPCEGLANIAVECGFFSSNVITKKTGVNTLAVDTKQLSIILFVFSIRFWLFTSQLFIYKMCSIQKYANGNGKWILMSSFL